MKRLLGYRPASNTFGREYASFSNATVPSTVNWVTGGAVTPVKDQG